MRTWISRRGSEPSGVAETLTPCERANLTGFSIHPLTVFSMASISKAVITTQGRQKRKDVTRRSRGNVKVIQNHTFSLGLICSFSVFRALLLYTYSTGQTFGHAHFKIIRNGIAKSSVMQNKGFVYITTTRRLVQTFDWQCKFMLQKIKEMVMERWEYVTVSLPTAKAILTIPLSKAVVPDLYLILGLQ